MRGRVQFSGVQHRSGGQGGDDIDIRGIIINDRNAQRSQRGIDTPAVFACNVRGIDEAGGSKRREFVRIPQ